MGRRRRGTGLSTLGFLVPPDELRLSGLIGGRNLTIVLVALASVSPI
jgi:hypothetical protein